MIQIIFQPNKYFFYPVTFLVFNLFFGVATNNLSAQTFASQKIENDVFRKQNPARLRHYKGRIDDLNDVAVSLSVENSNQCTGTLTYLRSGSHFLLKGTIEQDSMLLLHEFYADTLLSGEWKGILKEKNMLLDWSNVGNTLGSTMSLIEVKKEIITPSYCGDDKWIRSYCGSFLQSEAAIILQKNTDQRLTGTVFIKKEKRTYNISGILSENNLTTSMTLKNDYDQIVGTMNCRTNNGQLDLRRVTFIDKNKNNSYTSFELKEQLSVGCIEYADFMMCYDLIFPKTSQIVFNRWMDEVNTQWIEECRAHAERMKQQFVTFSPALRAAVRAYAWTEMSQISDRYLSGLVTFSRTWEERNESKSFNFDLLDGGKEVTKSQLFKKNTDYETFIQEYIFQELKRHPRYSSDAEFKTWAEKEPYTLFTIGQSGLIFFSTFNPVYGRLRITIPYDQLRPFLARTMEN